MAEREEVGAPPSDQSLGDTRKVCTLYNLFLQFCLVVLKYECINFFKLPIVSSIFSIIFLTGACHGPAGGGCAAGL